MRSIIAKPSLFARPSTRGGHFASRFVNRRTSDSRKGGLFAITAVAHALLQRVRKDIVAGDPRMRLRVAFFIACAVVVSGSRPYADARSDAKTQVEFGINVAQRGLWREAIYRWEKAVELDPSYAAAYNDLAVAYEHEGQLDKARKAYEKALELEPNNTEIRQNFELFKEINDRT